IALAVGSNTINIVIVAQDGVTTQTYSVVITRAVSGADGFGREVSFTEPANSIQVAEEGVKGRQGVSPNGDGIDDFLQIDNISQYRDNRLSIMNRSGQLVYESKGYDNSSKV